MSGVVGEGRAVHRRHMPPSPKVLAALEPKEQTPTLTIRNLRAMVAALIENRVPPLFQVVIDRGDRLELGSFYAIQLPKDQRAWLDSDQVKELRQSGEIAVGGDIVRNFSSPYTTAGLAAAAFLGTFAPCPEGINIGEASREPEVGCGNMHRQKALFDMDVRLVRRAWSV